MSIRRFSSLFPCLSIALVVGACTPTAGEDAGVHDAGGSDDAGAHDAGHDAGLIDAGTDAGANDAGVDDAGAHDGGADDDAGPDDDAGSDDDAGADDGGSVGDPVEAVPGARCAPAERVGLIDITSWGGDSYEASAELFDAPRPWFGPATVSDAFCALYEGAASCACGIDQACAFGGGCAPAPSPVAGLQLRLRAGEEEQLIEEEGQPGSVYASVTLPGSTFAVELSAGDLRVSLDATTVPGSLVGGAGQLQGDYSAPEQLDLTWTPTAADVDVFTHVPMNHHVAVPSFTECRVDGTLGALTVPGAMLAPLSISTGLEFQTLDTARFAAATTELGCVEIRFTRKQFVPIQ